MLARTKLGQILAYEAANLEILILKLKRGLISKEDISTAVLNTVRAKRYAVELAIDLTTPDSIREQASISAENALLYTVKCQS